MIEHKLPTLDVNNKIPTIKLGGLGADATKYLRGDQTWATPTVTLTGVIVSIFDDTVPASGTVPAGLNYNDMKVYNLANNSYSKIRTRATGYVFGQFSNVTCNGWVEIKWGDNPYASSPINFRVPATGAGDWFYMPFMIETSAVKTVATTIALRIWSETGSNQFNWYVGNFSIEGVI